MPQSETPAERPPTAEAPPRLPGRLPDGTATYPEGPEEGLEPTTYRLQGGRRVAARLDEPQSLARSGIARLGGVYGSPGNGGETAAQAAAHAAHDPRAKEAQRVDNGGKTGRTRKAVWLVAQRAETAVAAPAR